MGSPAVNPILAGMDPAVRASIVAAMRGGAPAGGAAPIPSPGASGPSIASAGAPVANPKPLATPQAPSPSLSMTVHHTLEPEPSQPISMPQPGMPETPSAPQPQVIKTPSQLEIDQARRNHILDSGSGISQIAHKIEGTQFGQNHPTLAKVLGYGAQGAATLGDIALSLTGPGRIAEGMIPGTAGYHAATLAHANSAVNQDEANAGKEATTADIQSQIPLRQAQTQEAQAHAADQPALDQAQIQEHNAQAAALLHPQAKTDFEAWQQQNPGKPIEDWLKVQSQNKNVQPKEQLQQQLVAAQNSGDTATAKKLQQQLKDIDPMGEQRVVIQQQNAANTQNRTADAKTEREFTYVRNKWDKDLQTYQSQNEKLSEAGDLIGKGAMGAALGSVKSLSGLAGGAGSGVRITQAELNSIAHARGFKGDFDAFLQQFGDGNKLTPEQVQSLKGIISDVQKIAGAKEAVINKALDDLNEAKDPATIRRIDSQVRHVLMGGQ
jgi:hypothetical protein